MVPAAAVSARFLRRKCERAYFLNLDAEWTSQATGISSHGCGNCQSENNGECVRQKRKHKISRPSAVKTEVLHQE